MTDHSFTLRKMAADGQGYFSEEDRLRLMNAADHIAELMAVLREVSVCLDGNRTGEDLLFAVRAAAAAIREGERK